MRPVKAIALSVNKKTGIRARLESGPVIRLLYDKNVIAGQRLLIRYDFTNKHPLGIVNAYSENNLPGPIKVEKEGENNDPENPETIELGLS